MKKSDIAKIVNVGAITQVLGSIMLEPTLLNEHVDDIDVDDFTRPFHKIVFGAFSSLISDGVESLDVPTVVNYIAQYPAQMSCFEANKGVEYLEVLQERANIKNFEYNLKQLKKYSKLREIAKCGMDITDIYNPNETDPELIEEQIKRMNKLEITDICEYFMCKITDACECKDGTSGTDYYDTSQSVDHTIASLGASRIGVPLTNSVISTAVKGCVGGKLIIESCGSGLGKSRKMLREACHLSIPFIYNQKTKQWEDTHMPVQSVLYVNTELDREESDIICLAYLTGIDSEKIELNKLTEEEHKIVEEAGELMKQYPFYVAILPEYSTGDIARLIDKYVLKHKIKMVFFDYIMENGRLLSEAQRLSGGIAIRPDQALLSFAIMLKAKAREKNIFIYTATQVNGNAGAGDDAQNRGVNSVRGAKSIVDKGDLAMVTFRPTPNDLKKLEPIIQGFGCSTKPNYAYSLHKNRGSKLTSCYVFGTMDLGTVREQPIIVTDYSYNPISVELLEVEFGDDGGTGALDVTQEEFDKSMKQHGINQGQEDKNEPLF